MKMKRILAFVLAAVMTASTFGCGKGGENDNGGGDGGDGGNGENIDIPADSAEGISFADYTVTDSDSALAAVKSYAAELGFTNAASELTVVREDTVDELTYYRMEQSYKSIPVYGGTFIAVSGTDGTGKAMFANAEDIAEDVDLTPSLTQETAEASIRALFPESEEVSVPELSDDKLVVYNYDDVDIPTLAYELEVYVYGTPYKVILDADSGVVYASFTLAYTSSAPVEDTANNMYVYDADKANLAYEIIHYDVNGNAYYRENAEKGIYYNESGQKFILDLSGSIPYFTIDDESENPIRFEGNINRLNHLYVHENHWIYTKPRYRYCFSQCVSDGSDKSEKAEKVLNLALTSDSFFENVFSRDGYNNKNGDVYLVIDRSFSNGNNKNAESSGYRSNVINGTVISVGHGYSTREIGIDLVAHEFMHSVERSISCMEYQGESGAIMEGYSDIFGELVEDWSSDNDLDGEDCNWENGKRVIKNPSVNNYPIRAEETVNGGEDYVHGHSTVISHIAYNMVEGNGDGESLTYKDLARLYYHTLYTLPRSCDFDTLRRNMLAVANSLNFSRNKLTRIKNSYDKANIDGYGEYGVTVNETYAVNPTIQVFGNDMQLYDNYIIEIKKNGKDQSQNVRIEVDHTNPVETQMSAGTYVIIVRDKLDESSFVAKTVEITDTSSDNNIVFATSFMDAVGLNKYSYYATTTDGYTVDVYCNNRMIGSYTQSLNDDIRDYSSANGVCHVVTTGDEMIVINGMGFKIIRESIDGVCVSDDGCSIVYSNGDAIYLYDVETSKKTLIVQSNTKDYVVSPNCKSVIYCCDNNIYMYKNGNTRLLCNIDAVEKIENFDSFYFYAVDDEAQHILLRVEKELTFPDDYSIYQLLEDGSVTLLCNGTGWGGVLISKDRSEMICYLNEDHWGVAYQKIGSAPIHLFKPHTLHGDYRQVSPVWSDMDYTDLGGMVLGGYSEFYYFDENKRDCYKICDSSFDEKRSYWRLPKLSHDMSYLYSINDDNELIRSTVEAKSSSVVLASDVCEYDVTTTDTVYYIDNNGVLYCIEDGISRLIAENAENIRVGYNDYVTYCSSHGTELYTISDSNVPEKITDVRDHIRLFSGNGFVYYVVYNDMTGDVVIYMSRDGKAFERFATDTYISTGVSVDVEYCKWDWTNYCDCCY